MQKDATSRKRHLIINHLKVVIVLFALLFLYSCDDNSDRVVNQTNPQQQFIAEDLVHLVRNDSTSFKESVVLVTGSIEDINYLNNRNTIILKGDETNNTSILCDLQEGQTKLLDSLDIGQTISIKGILKGSLKDIILLNCIISNQPNE